MPMPLPSRSAALMPQSNPRWLDILRRCGEECEVIELPGGWLAYAIRRTPIGTVVSSLPYVAYGGPIALDDDPGIIRALLDEYAARARDLGAAAATIGTPPFLGEDLERTWRELFAPTHVHENFAQVSILRQSAEQMLSSHRRNALRRNRRNALAQGYRAERATTSQQLDAWREIYVRRYAELGAVVYPEVLHRAMFELLMPRRDAELWLAMRGDEIIGGTLFLLEAATADYFAAAYLTEHRDASPQDLVLDHAFGDFIARGITRLNWESSPRKGEGVYTYKQRWGAREVPVFYYSRVFDDAILDRTAAEIREAFPLRFVVPFSALRTSP
jgi:Acetyltransferase (GNAT) domain